MTPLIGFIGYSGAGKDSAAAALVDDGWTRLAFADTLRAFLLAVNPVVIVGGRTSRFLPIGGRPVRLADLVRSYGWDKAKRSIPEVRELLQRVGTDAGRALLGDNVWADATLAKVSGPTCLTDVRFLNEAEMIRARGGVLVRVERPDCGPVNDHPSETALDSFDADYLIRNDGTLEDLARRVRYVAERATQAG